MRLRGVGEKLQEREKKGGRNRHQNEHRTDLPSENEINTDQKKGKVEVMEHEINTERGEPKTKRLKMDLPASEDTESERVAEDEEEIDVQLYCGPDGSSSPGQQPQPDDSLSVFPEHIKVNCKSELIVDLSSPNTFVFSLTTHSFALP